MSVQVLVAAMGQNDYSLLDKMNIQSDAIIGNQCDRNEITEIDYKGYGVKYLSFCERGVGLNRNNALMRATADYCLIADDDMVYVDGYAEIVEEAFLNNPEADVIIFNLIEEPLQRYVIKKKFTVNYLNFMRFGAARIAFRRESIRKNGIFFNLSFGGGTEHSHGEDTLFLSSCLKKKLKLVAVPIYIARLTEERDSTWFKGYDEKYFLDKGYLYGCISKPLARLLCLQDVLRHRRLYGKDMSIRRRYSLMVKGVKEFQK